MGGVDRRRSSVRGARNKSPLCSSSKQLKRSKNCGEHIDAPTIKIPGVVGHVDSYLDVSAMLKKDLRAIMYGYGDDTKPLQESVDLVGDITAEYITNLLLNSKFQAGNLKRDKVTERDLMFQVRKDGRKFHRVMQLLNLNEELKEARKAFQQDDLDFVFF
eukprot:TRINITY_DN3065_c0_g1_i1.p1 TRINITY_DN3065_c0_g1~~TRINITY_DN3065_c0_g1_i1.p1  ORF type:complete len:160 (-),score=20.37 TRINITY_DN3065_c0_g1_i1:371-850(-)